MYRRFTNRLFGKRNSPEGMIILIVSIISAIVVGIICFTKVDRVPATSEDFDELHEQLLIVQNNPSEFLKHKGNITIYDDQIVYEIENRKCEMKGIYTLDYHLIDYSQKDKTASLFLAIIICIGVGIVILFISHLVLFVIIFIGESLVIGTIYVYKKLASCFL